jgi:hypothetical protein
VQGAGGCYGTAPLSTHILAAQEEPPMIIVRNCFVAKPGQASKLAAQIKEAAKLMSDFKARVLTDLTGDFNRVILEYEAQDAADFESRLREYQSNSAFREKMKGYTDLYITGSREILQIM